MGLNQGGLLPERGAANPTPPILYDFLGFVKGKITILPKFFSGIRSRLSIDLDDDYNIIGGERKKVMNIQKAINIILYGGSCPDGISVPRWNAIVAHVTRNYL